MAAQQTRNFFFSRFFLWVGLLKNLLNFQIFFILFFIYFLVRDNGAVARKVALVPTTVALSLNVYFFTDTSGGELAM